MLLGGSSLDFVLPKGLALLGLDPGQCRIGDQFECDDWFTAGSAIEHLLGGGCDVRCPDTSIIPENPMEVFGG